MKKMILRMTFAAMMGVFAVTAVAGPVLVTAAAAEAGQEQPAQPGDGAKTDAPPASGSNDHAGHH